MKENETCEYIGQSRESNWRIHRGLWWVNKLGDGLGPRPGRSKR